jgi:hypothetical protein
MSSRSSRQATAIRLLAHALVGAHDSPHIRHIGAAVERLNPHVLASYDRAMKRVQAGLLAFANGALIAGEDGFLPNEHLAAWLHMLTALVGDQWQQCPAQPADRKRNWRRLNNAIAEMIEAGDPTGEVGVELGCAWADEVFKILNGV